MLKLWMVVGTAYRWLSEVRVAHVHVTLDHSPSRLAVAEDRRRHQRDAAGGWEGDIH
jgi:hypothetical protein